MKIMHPHKQCDVCEAKVAITCQFHDLAGEFREVHFCAECIEVTTADWPGKRFRERENALKQMALEGVAEEVLTRELRSLMADARVLLEVRFPGKPRWRRPK
jgi:hypothetical protein